ncbi:MAG: hypothetical protein LBJ62_09840 [Bifidobacteriaceae bacterium]|nr:hypothetical protein [Bifidobacteriaceae bacterium]
MSLEKRELEKQGYTEQAEMLEDGQVTDEEFREAFDLMAECLVAADVEILGPWVNPVDGVRLDFSAVFDDGVDHETARETVQSCWLPYWDSVSAWYVDTHPHVMDPPLRELVAECLEEKGYVLTGDEMSVEDFAGPDRRKDPVGRPSATKSCVTDVINETDLYGDQAITIAYDF